MSLMAIWGLCGCVALVLDLLFYGIQWDPGESVGLRLLTLAVTVVLGPIALGIVLWLRWPSAWSRMWTLRCSSRHFDLVIGQTVDCHMISGHRGKHSNRRIQWE